MGWGLSYASEQFEVTGLQDDWYMEPAHCHIAQSLATTMRVSELLPAFYHGVVSSPTQLILQKTVLLYGMMLLDNLEQYWVPIALSKSWQSEQKRQPQDTIMCITGRVHVPIGLQFLPRERMTWIGKKSCVTFNYPLEVFLRGKANNFHFYLPQWSIFGPWSVDI